MMRRAITAMALVTLALPVFSAEATNDTLIKEARQHTKQLAMQLKQTLKKSMQADGPQAAIQVCNTKAPEIAATLSQGDWQVGRTALKIRNGNNTPDAWEQAVMQAFVAQLNAGADVSTLEASKTEGGTFRYMKAIPTGGVCLACHGEKIAPPISARLAELYPNDQARGFSQGELRGAFTLSKTLK